MIIDAHYHLMPRVNRETAEHLAEHAVRAARIMGRAVDPEAMVQKALETWPDPAGDRLMTVMESAGIDVTVICMVDDVRNQQLTAEGIQKGNRIVGEVAARYPGRVVALAGVDPRRPEAADLLKQCFEEFGVRGLKYHPDYGYDPCGARSYAVLQVLAQHRGILLTHTGPLMPPSRCRLSDPMLLADLAVDFPEVPVIAAHMGGVDWRPWAGLAAHQPNLYGDLAMWDVYAFGHYPLFCRELRDILDYAGPSKVLFGTDNPIFNTIEPTKNWIQLIRDLPENAADGIRFTPSEVSGILGGNAARILGLA
jgi:predicted TIM-barrel fold metal-dependent hydrolase